MANNIRKERQKKGMTLKTLSDELSRQGVKISADGLAKYERGIREPKLEIWRKLADFFDVPVTKLMGMDDIDKQVSNMLSELKKNNDKMLSDQLDRISSSELHEFESSTLATAIKTVMDLYERYGFNDDEIIEASVMLSSFNRMIKNEVDDDDDYQDTIDIFTKLVNNLKEQNKKASE